jgi:hypothetical protein
MARRIRWRARSTTTQVREVIFPVGTVGAREFGTVIASTWVAAQQ